VKGATRGFLTSDSIGLGSNVVLIIGSHALKGAPPAEIAGRHDVAHADVDSLARCRRTWFRSSGGSASRIHVILSRGTVKSLNGWEPLDWSTTSLTSTPIAPCPKRTGII
jgi:hypothetical protein